MMIFDSLSDDCIRVIDTGNRRSPGDAFKILGVEDYARISAGTRVYYNYLNHPEIVWTGLTSKNITNDELFLFYEMDVGKERADAAAKLAREAYRGWSYLNQSVVFALILILDDANFHYDTSHSVMSFLGDLALGENLQSGDPVLAYRRQAMNRTGRRAHSSKWQQVLLNSFIKLWNSRQKFKQDGKPVMRFLEPQDTPMQTVNPS
jgi:hypothetical protein